jgi:hypothetical protein
MKTSKTQPSEVPLVNIGNVADGAVVELFETKIHEVYANIADINTSVRQKRTLTIKLTFTPHPDRKGAAISTTCETKLAGIEPHESTIYVAKDEDGNLFGFTEDPRQQVMFPKKEEPKANIEEIRTLA